MMQRSRLFFVSLSSQEGAPRPCASVLGLLALGGLQGACAPATTGGDAFSSADSAQDESLPSDAAQDDREDSALQEDSAPPFDSAPGSDATADLAPATDVPEEPLASGDAGGSDTGSEAAPLDAGPSEGGAPDARDGASACSAPGDCDDGVFCNGQETCVSSRCVPGAAVDCNDRNSCTADRCDEALRRCVSTDPGHLTAPAACGATGSNDCVVCAVSPAAQHSSATCAAGVCGTRCDAPFVDADGDPSNGCECSPSASVDDPDDAYLDTNCDGIDGTASAGVFVALSGADTAGCGTSAAAPCRTLAFATARAAALGRHDLFLGPGNYDEVVVLSAGLRLFGGYDARWRRGPLSNPANRATLRGGLDASTGRFLTVRAHNLSSAAHLEELELRGPAVSVAGESSYVLHVLQSTLRGRHLSIVATDGAAGPGGAAGTDAVLLATQSYMSGGAGGSGGRPSTTCDSSNRGGGGASGTNTCTASPSARLVNGGAAGAGGTMDTSCALPLQDFTATPGAAGSPASYAGATQGRGGLGGTGASLCGPAGAGAAGALSNGARGLAGTSARGALTSNFWRGANGASGGTGENGGGGGGGGGAGGCDIGADSYGAGGGGGGAGGCAARSGGGGGGAGGGSFGLLAVQATVELTSCAVALGNGGRGGDGGVGGQGQSGGPGGAAGAAPAGTGTAGSGGAGAHGGHGGGGAGGSGGVAFGILSSGSTVNLVTVTFSGGAPGAGGAGGRSAPSAPAAERDGNDGENGVAGVRGDVEVCVAPSGC